MATIKSPGNNGYGGNNTQANIRAGQRVALSQFVGLSLSGTYRGTIVFVQSVGRNGADGPIGIVGPQGSRRNGTLVVGHFTFKLPLKHP